MKKQKICIIGGSLTGLVTAIALSKLNCEIDIVTERSSKNIKSNRTIAISENNLHFLKKLNLSKSLEKEVWACSSMKLYSENKDENFSEVFALHDKKDKKKILYMFENSKIITLMIQEIKKIKTISLIKHKIISDINDSGSLKKIKLNNVDYKYNLIIICTGSGSRIVKNLFHDKLIGNSYQETSITTILSHDKFKNDIARQIFLNDGILALLPISNTKTSIVWSTKKKIKKKSFIRNKIKSHTKNYLKNVKFITKFEYKDLNFLIRNKYYQDRILLFGDALHLIHPFVGQGFNMTLRDLASLENILKEKINLGLDVGSLDILSEFSDQTKPRNLIFSLGTDFLKNSFSLNRLRDSILKISNKSNFIKNIFFNVADKGFKF